MNYRGAVQLFLASFAICAGGSLPGWYTAHGTHAHTRLPIDVSCNNNNTARKWECSDVFEHAAADFASLGVKAFVRHTHTGDEGTWWNSSVVPQEGWHQLVQDTGRNLPYEFLQKAKAAGIHVIF